MIGQETHQQMDELRFSFCTVSQLKIDDRLEAQGLVILLPTISDQDRIRMGERNRLELWSSVRIRRRVNTAKDDDDRCGNDHGLE